MRDEDWVTLLRMGEFVRLGGATILGALIAFGSTFFFERRREMFAAAKRFEANRVQMRQAARLVFQELLEVASSVQLACDANEPLQRWWVSPPTDLPTAAWREYRGVLASWMVDDDDWHWLAGAYGAVDRLNQQVEAYRSGQRVIGNEGELPPYDGTGELGAVPESWQEELRLHLGEIEYGIELVRPLLQKEDSDSAG
jgi:hypothetical protein